MDAVFSGQSGTLTFIEGADVRVRRASDLEEEIVLPRETAEYLFHACNDAVFLRGVKRDVAEKKFAAAWEADRALRLLLISLDVEEDPEIRFEAAFWLETVLPKKEIRTFIENQFYSRPLPPDTDIDFYLKNGKWQKTSELVGTIVRQQPTISVVRRAWDSLPKNLFDNDRKAYAEELVIRQGGFRILASVDLSKDDPNLAILSCYQVLASLPNSRNIVFEWTKEFLRPRSRHLDIKPEEEDVKKDDVDQPAEVRSHQAFETAMQQQKAIIEKMKAGSQRLARIYTEQLVEFQLGKGGPKFAAKSLCNLAQEAKFLGLFSLQLEWAQRAVDLCPDDSHAHGQAADALLQFSRLDEASKELDLTEAYGDAYFAATGRARILRYQGRLEEALAAFRGVRHRLPGNDQEPFSWSGSAETLREMWRLDAALEEYENAIKHFPDVQAMRCGRAAVLADLGRLDEALEAYEAPYLRENLVALNGRASVLKQLGRFDEGLKVASHAIALVPTDPIARSNYADILRAKGDFTAALQVYLDIQTQYPMIPVAYGGYAEVLRDMRRLPDAILAYKEAVLKFPNDPYLANGHANIYKVNDDLEESLRLYEKSVRKFPYDLFAKSGRADLLKRLGRYEDAITAYDQIIGIWPKYEAARNGKAAILALRGRYNEALSLLPTEAAKTRDDWIALHVRGMIFLRKKELDVAIDIFERGRLETPFVRERRYFEGALSVAKMRKGEFEQAAQTLRDTSGGLTNVLKLHAYAGMGNRPLAQKSYRDLSTGCPAQLLDLKEAIAAWYKITDEPIHHNDNWIFERESEALLQEAA